MKYDLDGQLGLMPDHNRHKTLMAYEIDVVMEDIDAYLRVIEEMLPNPGRIKHVQAWLYQIRRYIDLRAEERAKCNTTTPSN